MIKHELKYCQRCHAAFECKAGDILNCQCNRIRIDENTQNYLARNYKDCICVHCMAELQEILKRNKWSRV